ncbi:predicted protein, partial [Nematostella vectensis]
MNTKFMTKFIQSKENEVLDSLKLNHDVQALTRLNGISKVTYTVEKDTISNHYTITFKIIENFSIIPNSSLWTTDETPAAYRVGLYEFNLLGKNNVIGGFYQFNGISSFGFNFSSPFLFNENLGIETSYQNLGSVEPIFFEGTSARYEYINRSFELLGVYRTSFKNTIKLGGNIFNEKYQYKSGATSERIPLRYSIDKILFKLNNNYDNLKYDFYLIDARRGTLNIEFKLAKIDPNGACTTGVVFHDVKSGFGNGGGYDSDIQADAWDNYKYMNVYIQNDLYDDGDLTNSGVAWYPNTSMSDNNLARVVYNGAYLYGNTSNEFASVLTHEFGHFLNLIHTFEGGCTGTDQVSDTPNENGNHDLGCTPGTNCSGGKVNIENYMGYNGASGCYKMFTQGQINRMLAALQHPARTTLWQNANLTATGVNATGGYIASATSTFKEAIANNGTFTSNAVINATAATFSQSSGAFTQGTHFTHTFPAGLTPVITVNSNAQVTVTVNGTATNHVEANNTIAKITFLPAAFSGASTVYCNSISYALKFRDPYGIFFVDMADATVAGSTNWKYFEISKGD